MESEELISLKSQLDYFSTLEKHPNVLTIDKIYEHKNEIQITHESFSSISLVDILEQFDTIKMSEYHISYVMRSIALGIQHLHKRQFSMAKLQSDVILIGEDGNLRINLFDAGMEKVCGNFLRKL